MLTHACDPRTQEGEVEGSHVESRSGLCSQNLFKKPKCWSLYFRVTNLLSMHKNTSSNPSTTHRKKEGGGVRKEKMRESLGFSQTLTSQPLYCNREQQNLNNQYIKLSAILISYLTLPMVFPTV